MEGVDQVRVKVEALGLELGSGKDTSPHEVRVRVRVRASGKDTSPHETPCFRAYLSLARLTRSCISYIKGLGLRLRVGVRV